MDIDACDANTDSDPDPGICGVAFQDDMERTAMIGSPAILPDGTILFWELGLDFSADPQDRDVVALGPEGILWEASLPGDREWTSCITVTDNHVIGTASHVELSSEQLATLTFPSFTDDALVILDRETGEQVFEHPLPDDGAATVTIGSDGALYAGIMGFLSILSVDDRPDLGLVRLRPVAP